MGILVILTVQAYHQNCLLGIKQLINHISTCTNIPGIARDTGGTAELARNSEIYKSVM